MAHSLQHEKVSCFIQGDHLAALMGSNVIAMDDLEGFSQDLIDAVKLILRR